MSHESVQDHYDISAKNYHLQYERDLLSDVTRTYPANYFRLHLLLRSFLDNRVERVVEVGVGEGTPLITLARTGVDVAGFDISRAMVSKARENLKKNGLDEDSVIWADVQDPITYSPLLLKGRFDALLAMGVMPHVVNDEFVLRNMKSMVKPGGRVFIEFRNKLFSLFTFNRLTLEFILDDLLQGVNQKLRDAVERDLKNRLEMSRPSLNLRGESANLISGSADGPGYDSILSKFHNPFEVIDLFAKCGFVDARLLWYHYHPAMPHVEESDRQLFRDEALNLEHETSGWRGMFLCSAFVVEASVPADG